VSHFRTTPENEGLAERCSVNCGSAKRIGAVGRIPTNFLVDAARKVGTLVFVMSLTTHRSAAPVASATAFARASEVVVVLALIAVVLVVLLVIGPAGTGTL
jgi:ADP-ribosylglycohydrolase